MINDQGETTLRCIVHQTAKEVDEDGTAFEYIWTRLGKNGELLDEGVFATGKEILVTASDVEEVTTFVCEVASAALAQYTITKRNDIITSPTEPENKTEDMLWLDTSTPNPKLKRWDGQQWVSLSAEMTPEDRGTIERMRTELDVNKEAIEMRVTKEVFNNAISDKVSIGDVSSMVRNEVSFAITSGEIQNTFTTYEERINALEKFEDTVTSYQRFTAEGLELGRSDSDIIAKLSNDRLSFMQNNAPVAYISEHKLYATEANVTNRFSIGNMNNGYFDWLTTSTGLGLKWRKQT